MLYAISPFLYRSFQIISMLTAILLSVLAGRATGVGGLIVINMKGVSKRMLGFGLGLSSGIMVIIGIRDLFGKSVELGNYYFAVISFMAGALFILAIDVLVPHEFIFSEHGAGRKTEAAKQLPSRRAKSCLMAAGIVTALGITIHNIPEGTLVGA